MKSRSEPRIERAGIGSQARECGLRCSSERIDRLADGRVEVLFADPLSFRHLLIGRLFAGSHDRWREHFRAGCGYSAKNSSAVIVFVCCSAARSTPRLVRKPLDSAATWNASAVIFSLRMGIGPSTESWSRSIPSGVWAA
jgi:hypothetical protein